MATYLSSELRTLLENTVIKARQAAEAGANAALVALSVAEPRSPFEGGSAQGRLRNGLRARARQLGDGREADGLGHLVEEVAYVQWHRMLFARFLAENGLLVHPSGAPVSLEECAELAPDEGEPDEWMLAARYAAQMLPGIFPLDDPSAQVRFAADDRQALEAQLKGLPRPVFVAEDALGWAYQFWQAKRKAELNKGTRRIGGADISPVTQLFTEPYMVRFLLENSLGAWWAARRPTSRLLQQFEYLRFRDDGAPAAGAFAGWPETAAKVRVLDPSCGSGHFLVVALGMLRQMRQEEEGLSEADAAYAVLRDNLFGLELDPRCTQIAAFALAFTAWKAGGVRPLPVPHVVCCGIPVRGQLETWQELAGPDPRLRRAMERLYDLFRNAPDLGSLISPTSLALGDRLFTADYAEVAHLLTVALAGESGARDPAAAVFGAAARGVARAAELLAGTYTLVATNVPYLVRGKQGEILRTYCEARYPNSCSDLATAFVERCAEFCDEAGTHAVVAPQNWLFLTSYRRVRELLLRRQSWALVARVGSGAVSTASWEVLRALTIVSALPPTESWEVASVDAPAPDEAGKDRLLRGGPLRTRLQHEISSSPDCALTFATDQSLVSFGTTVSCYQGTSTGDNPRFVRRFWEVQALKGWTRFQGAPATTSAYIGRTDIAAEALFDEQPSGSAVRGAEAWGRLGVAVAQMRTVPATLYTGERFANTCPVIVPRNPADLAAVWSFCSSKEFNAALREVNQKMSVDNGYVGKLLWDPALWRRTAAETFPEGLPHPSANDPAEWLFNGHPFGSTDPLQVAVARLLGYRWPDQPADPLDAHADADGIVCIPAVARELPASERLRGLLTVAWRDDWSNGTLDHLLADAGYTGKSLDTWLRDGFFPAHNKCFDNRPFIWQIWDGHPAGFSALVNYHRLDRATLQKLTYTYLGDWITAQKTAKEAQDAGAEGRLAAALSLQAKLRTIEEGAPPLDIYVRWKPLDQQPIGWDPDINDGVRINVRPFVTAGVLRSKFTVNWNKDRGANPDGSDRLNDLHPSLEERRAAREAHGER